MNEKQAVKQTIEELYQERKGRRLMNAETRRRYEANGGKMTAAKFHEVLRELEKDGFIRKSGVGFYIPIGN